MIKKLFIACIFFVPVFANADTLMHEENCKFQARMYDRLATQRDNGSSLNEILLEIDVNKNNDIISPEDAAVQNAIAKKVFRNPKIDPVDFYQLEYAECMKRQQMSCI